jgi:carbon monoxide dehydrogenase subunit G
MQGEVLVCESPRRLQFRQIGSAKIWIPLGTIAITIDYDLSPTDNGTQLTRTQSVELTGILRLLEKRLMHTMKQENTRILETLRQHLESVM